MEQAKAIDYFNMRHPLRRLASIVSLKARKKMFSNFIATVAPSPSDRIVDIGVTPDRSLPESNFFENLYPFKERLTATSIEDASFLEEMYPGLAFVRTSGSTLPFADGAFNVVVCFAVLEHVGDREAQRTFVRELLRVGRKLYLTTPNRGFPLELHTFLPLLHWLPQRSHQSVLRAIGLHFWSKTENLNLLGEDDLRDLFPHDAPVRIIKHKLFGMTSNLIAVYA